MNEPRTRLAAMVLRRPTLSAIAREAGVSVGLVSKIAAGKRKPTPRVRAAAAVVLGFDSEFIFPPEEAA
jgi:transcriptional regulator with XRE-family HTH domain